ncbi:uncharacterized protein FA14DRAFT_154447 [Meira miltonrushii]|uniref:Uncharacterized protein n=1 Tax=Meira miltonrushii TaxID=1280837 RepID=A0A316VBL4_9BASI|nr:uncharacterized protein FA14DRAFT_154447 [Meira miltonrushii]PWN35019.1 hypothetical protein FA14DRAFT_154447 [Meira miltonrushii]
MKPFSKTALPLLLIMVVLTNALLAFSKSPNLNRNKHATENTIRRKRDSPAKVPIVWKREANPETNVKLDPRSPEKVKIPNPISNGRSKASSSQQKRNSPAKVPVQWKRGTSKLPERNVKLDPSDEDDLPSNPNNKRDNQRNRE